MPSGEPAAAPHQSLAPTAERSGQAGGVFGLAGSMITGDAVAGRQVFKKCEACHSLEPGKNLVGPSLAGVIGRRVGSVPGYDYSPAMKQSNIVWSAVTLDSYLTDPQKVVPGNKMPFPGLKTDRDRADVIAVVLRSLQPRQVPGAPQILSSAIFPTQSTRCVLELGKDGWFSSAKAVTLTAK
jgi:nitrite reductase (NO-forming)